MALTRLPAIAALAICGWVLAAVKLRAYLLDRRASPVLRDYTVCTAALAGVFTLLVPSVVVAVDRVSANLALLLNSLLGLVCLTAAQSILESSWGDPVDIRRRVRRWWLTCLALDGVRAVLFVAAPARFHRVEVVDFAQTYTEHPTLAAFNLLRLGWFTIIFWNVHRTFRGYAPQEPTGSTRLGLRLHAWVGTLGLAYVAYELAYMAGRVLGRPLPGSERQVGQQMLSGIVLLLLLATIVLYLGPAAETRRIYRSLATLWETVAARRDGAVLDDASFSTSQRLIRRRQENIDGLARLGPYFEQSVWRHAHQTALAAGKEPGDASDLADAAMILAAAHAEARQLPAMAGEPEAGPVWIPQDDLAWQSRISRALQTPLVRSSLAVMPVAHQSATE